MSFIDALFESKSPQISTHYIWMLYFQSLLISKASSSPIFLTPHPRTTGRVRQIAFLTFMFGRHGIPSTSWQALPSVLPHSCKSEQTSAKLGPSTYTFCPLVTFFLLILLVPSFHIPESYPVFIYFLILFLYFKLSDYSHCSCLVRLGRFHCVWIGFRMRLDKLNYGNLQRSGWEITIWMHVIMSQQHSAFWTFFFHTLSFFPRWKNSFSSHPSQSSQCPGYYRKGLLL